MKEQNFDKSEQQQPFDVEQRLRAYYGPQLREQPLAQASWQHLRSQLGSQEGTRRRRRLHLRFARRRSRGHTPAFIQQAFARITYEARVPLTQSRLRCSMKPRRHEPVVRGSWWGKHKVWLRLPLNALMTMGGTELDVLLATGLARSIGARQSKYTLGRLLLVGLLLIACLTLFLLWMHRIPLIGLLVALLLIASVAWLWHRQARSLAFHADTLIVLWLGRSHVCSGLHAMADHSQKPEHRRWGEPSLAERIKRVCGTRVETRSNQLTLVG